MEIYMNIMSLTAVELGKRIKAKEISVEEAVYEFFFFLNRVKRRRNSFLY